MFGISGKVALVSGGASGIGLATVKGLLQDGLKGVTIVDLNETNGNQVVEDLNQKYGDNKALFCKANVSQRNEFEDAFKSTISAFQNLDIVINCAGIIKDRNWEEEIAVNLGGVVSGTYFAFENYLPKYKSGFEGVIVNVSSTVAIDLYALAPVYSATKSAVLAFSRNYGSPIHYERNQVRVMTICPGFTDTPICNPHNEKLLLPVFYDISKQELEGMIIQPVEHVANAIINMIKVGRNGSVWVSEDCKPPFEMEFLSKKKN